jgi:hypothetical protein
MGKGFGYYHKRAAEILKETHGIDCLGCRAVIVINSPRIEIVFQGTPIDINGDYDPKGEFKPDNVNIKIGPGPFTQMNNTNLPLSVDLTIEEAVQKVATAISESTTKHYTFLWENGAYVTTQDADFKEHLIGLCTQYGPPPIFRPSKYTIGPMSGGDDE